MLSPDEKRILRWSLTTRICTVLLAILSSVLVAPFDESGRIALRLGHPPDVGYLKHDDTAALGSTGASLLDRLALPFTQWDTVHFLAIAKDGYRTEQQFAFAPGVPSLLRLAGGIALPGLQSSTSFDARVAVIIVGALAFSASVVAPLMLFRLTLALLGKDQTTFARTASLLYCLHPAPAISSVPYTEPFFALFTLLGMLSAVQRRYLLSSVTFSIATCFRATGVFNAGFLVWYLLWRRNIRQPIGAALAVVKASFLACIVAAPFLAQQRYAYSAFCGDVSPRPWCAARVPLIYSFVQDHYWNVGFLRYFTVQQLPNFLLASPILVLAFSASWSHYSYDWARTLRLTVPFARRIHPESASHEAIFSPSLLPFFHLHTLLSLLLFFTSHVQIALRQACTNPVLFWYAAHLYQRRASSGKMWVHYCVIWGALSTVLWTAFYPPA